MDGTLKHLSDLRPHLEYEKMIFRAVGKLSKYLWKFKIYIYIHNMYDPTDHNKKEFM